MEGERILSAMRLRLSTFLALALVALSGCASVSSTAQFYLPMTSEVFPPKPRDFQIPILGAPPEQPYKVIGRLAFRSDLGWRFLRESMIYNARRNGADAVILRDATSREQVNYTQVPPSVDWVTVPGPVVAVNSNGRKGCGNVGYVTYPRTVPIFQPGYVSRWVQTILSINAEMIVFK